MIIEMESVGILSYRLCKAWFIDCSHIVVFDSFLCSQMPLNIQIRETSDAGKPIVVACPESEAAGIYQQMAHRIQAKLQDQRKRTSTPIIR
jgi:nitrogenase subunit NifH